MDVSSISRIAKQTGIADLKYSISVWLALMLIYSARRLIF